MNARMERTGSDLGLSRVILPAEDRRLSPYTGWGRAHWAGVAEDLLLSTVPYRSPSGSRIVLPGRPSKSEVRSDGLEAFARTFLLAAFVHVGDQSPDRERHLDRYIAGLVAGTAPYRDGRIAGPVGQQEEAWDPIADHGAPGAQLQVEAASVALALHLTRDSTWDRLSPADQGGVAGWLRGGLSRRPAPNNWYLFPLTVASFLEAVGQDDAQTRHVIARGLSLLDGWYRGDGWYSDGDGQAFDHYVGWALHLYPLLHARLRGATELEHRLAERLRAFLDGYSLTFDRTGAPLHLGRSLTYRMGALAAVALGEVVDATPLDHGQSRRIMSATLRYFLERGAVVDGILTLGWHGPHAATVQRYSGPGSPYWASKGFAGLMLPETHPLWVDREQALPADEVDLVRPLGPTGLLLQVTARDGLVRVHNHGSDHLHPHEADAGTPDPLYARFAYSARTGPTPAQTPTDNDIQVHLEGGWSVRRRIHRLKGGRDWAASWHAPRFPGPVTPRGGASDGLVLPSVRIDSVVVARGWVEVRIHRLHHVPPGCSVRLSGWPVAGTGPSSLVRTTAGLAPPAVQATVATAADAAPLVSHLVAVHGWSLAATATVGAGTAYGPWAAVPELYGSSDTPIFVALAGLSATDDTDALPALADVHLDGPHVQIDWSVGAPTSIDLTSLQEL